MRLPPVGSTEAPEPELAALLHEWDRKLAESGLKSIEHRHPNGTLSHHLPNNASDLVARYRPDVEAYYRYAAQHLYRRRWDDDRECEVWALHAEGVPTYQIARQLRCREKTVAAIIRRERARMLRACRGAWNHGPPRYAPTPRAGTDNGDW